MCKIKLRSHSEDVIILSVCVPVCFYLSKSRPSAAADVEICVTSLVPCRLKLRPHCLCRHHRTMRHKFMVGQSMCFSKLIIPEKLNLIDTKSNFAHEILKLMHVKSNLEGACFFTYTSGGFIHIHLTRQLQCEAGLWESLCCVLCNTVMLIELVY